MVKIEFFSVPGCSKCNKAQEEFQILIQEFGEEFSWRPVNILEEIDYAIELGLLSTPAIVINKKVLFTSVPTLKEFRDELIKYWKI